MSQDVKGGLRDSRSADAGPPAPLAGPRPPRDTVERNVEALLHGPAKYTLCEAARKAGLEPESARKFWLSMGFPSLQDENLPRFRDYDVEAMRAHAKALAPGDFTDETLASLNRAQSHMSDRLVLWQHEVLVEYARTELGLDGISARYWVLDNIKDYQDYLRAHMEYSWHRHMAALLRRSETEVAQMELLDAENAQLLRAFGFIDMVAFTNRSNELGSAEFIHLIEEFDYTCRDIIYAAGARVVKTIGDAFLYIADDLVTGAEVSTGIVQALRNIEGMLPVRASLVWGGVVSRFGDIFGPKVNLASRLVDVADSGAVLTDKDTAGILRNLRLGRYTLVPAGSPTLQGFGKIDAVELRRMPTA